MNNTICAISTAPGIGGIAVVRVSGPDAISIADSIFHGKRQLKNVHAGSVVFGEIRMSDNAVLDEVLVSVFHAPHSFTGEDVVEISCHGSRYVQRMMLSLLIDNGCRMAEPGEFTKRAFMNGKMDLSEAEAVADLIASESRAAHGLAMSQMRGGVSNELAVLRNKLLHFTSLLELELDFADHEDLEFVDRSELNALCEEIKSHLAKLTATFKVGNSIKNGVPVAIIGPTNAGKSTLLNALVGEERAIVSDVQGTTRDTIEDTIVIDGILFRFIDTAGLRQTANEIETIGIQRSLQAAEKAQLVILLQDVRDKETPEYNIPTDKIIRVFNKIDLLDKDFQPQPDSICISAKNGDIAKLKAILVERSGVQNAGDVLISNARHYEALKLAGEAISRVEHGLAVDLTGELLALDLHDCLNALGEITGEVSSQEVLNNIFAHFCIGK